MKASKVLDFLKWFFAFAIFGVAIYAIYNAWKTGRDFFKPSDYAKDPKKGQTTFEKYFPNVAEVKDKIVEAVKPSQYASDPKKGQTTFEKYFPNVAEVWDNITGKKKDEVTPIEPATPSKKITVIQDPDKQSFSFESVINKIFEPVRSNPQGQPSNDKINLPDLTPVVNTPLPVSSSLKPSLIVTSPKTLVNTDPPVQSKTENRVYRPEIFIKKDSGRKIVVPVISKPR